MADDKKPDSTNDVDDEEANETESGDDQKPTGEPDRAGGDVIIIK